MELFRIKTGYIKEDVEVAMISACTPFKRGTISTAYDERKEEHSEKSVIKDVVIRDVTKNVVLGIEDSRTMAYLKEEEASKGKNKYLVHVWGRLDEQAQIKCEFLKKLNLTENDITNL